MSTVVGVVLVVCSVALLVACVYLIGTVVHDALRGR